ncbi:hypothetical protein ACGFT2_24600 [Streptomyces sp. NPDC048514]|uniref:hypothetical protein n=1 Tax=Streptomyces sp. NPDC048514 TaxID=3365564 RepID=UPI00371BAC2B
MNLRARLRTSSAVWTSPLWVGIVVFYFFYVLHLREPYEAVVSGPLWAPEQVERALFYFYPFAYAVTCALAVWEGGRLRHDGVWGLAPGRSRFRVAAHTLAPVIGAGWLVLGLPVGMRLVETGLLPTLPALSPLLLGMGLVVAWAVIGCGLGHITPRLISAPLSAVAVFFLIIKTGQVEPVWLRHVSGSPDTSPDFGEQYRAVTLIVPFLFTGCVAVAVAAWWLPAARMLKWTLRATTVAAVPVVMALCAQAASGWGYGDGPVSSGHAPARCAGSAPRVCMARTGGSVDQLPRVRSEVVSTLTALRRAGVRVAVPETVSDRVLTGRRQELSNAQVWWLPLSEAMAEHSIGPVGVRYGVLVTSVRFPCAFPSSFKPGQSDWVVNHDAALLWAATVVDADKPYQAWLRNRYATSFQNAAQVLAKVDQRVSDARKLTPKEQTDWFDREQAKACGLVEGAVG